MAASLPTRQYSPASNYPNIAKIPLFLILLLFLLPIGDFFAF